MEKMSSLLSAGTERRPIEFQMRQFVNSVSCAVKRFRRVVGLNAVNIFLLNGQFEQIKVTRIGILAFEKHNALLQSFKRIYIWIY